MKDHDENDAPSDLYTVSVFYDRWTADEFEAGETNDRGIELDRHKVTLDDLERINWDYGFTEPSSSRLSDRMWFRSIDPRHDRDFIERGIHTYYTLHIHAVNDRDPTDSDLAKVAEILKIRLDPRDELDDEMSP